MNRPVCHSYLFPALLVLVSLTVWPIEGAAQDQAAVSAQPEEAARIQQQLTRFLQTRQRAANEAQEIKRQLAELEIHLQALDDQAQEMELSIESLMGNEEFILNRQRSDLRQWMQWGLVILTGGVTFIFFKIRRSRLRETARLEKYRQHLSDARRVD